MPARGGGVHWSVPASGPSGFTGSDLMGARGLSGRRIHGRGERSARGKRGRRTKRSEARKREKEREESNTQPKKKKKKEPKKSREEGKRGRVGTKREDKRGKARLLYKMEPRMKWNP